ncbi:MAG: anaerobic ribonucleoside-triphosphate reductase activating protein [Pseudomonadota bacterium]
MKSVGSTMKLPNIKGFLPVSMLDWPGKVCSVIFLGGCSFRCPACHNHKLVLAPESCEDIALSQVVSYLREKSGWVDGVTITGGEPTCHPGLPEFVRQFRKLGLDIKIDTNGFNPSMLEKLIKGELIDAVAMDVKAPLEKKIYSRLAGVDVDLKDIQRSIEVIKTSGIRAFFRTTAIPGLVGEKELRSIWEDLGDACTYSVQRFRNIDTLDPEFRKIPSLDLEIFDCLQSHFQRTDSDRPRHSIN